jgi:hypothetical protein
MPEREARPRATTPKKKRLNRTRPDCWNCRHFDVCVIRIRLFELIEGCSTLLFEINSQAKIDGRDALAHTLGANCKQFDLKAGE